MLSWWNLVDIVDLYYLSNDLEINHWNRAEFGETLTDNDDGNTEPSYYYNCKNLVTSGPHTLMVNHELRTVVILEGVETGRQLPKL